MAPPPGATSADGSVPRTQQQPPAQPTTQPQIVVGAIRLVIADADGHFRNRVAELMGRYPGFELVDIVTSGLDVVDRCVVAHPHVVLLDAALPHCSPIEVVRQLQVRSPTVRCVVLSDFEQPQELFEAIKARARGYMTRDIADIDLIDGVRSVVAGHWWMSPMMATALADDFATPAETITLEEKANNSKLTDRELEVLKLIATGMGNREIASRLYISENTVKNHVRSILDKLRLHSRTEAVVYAVKQRIVDLTADGVHQRR